MNNTCKSIDEIQEKLLSYYLYVGNTDIIINSNDINPFKKIINYKPFDINPFIRKEISIYYKKVYYIGLKPG